MPVNCQTCPFVQNEYPIGGEALVYRCRCTFTQKIAGNALERNKDCPLGEIPPHGRLFDADALLDNLLKEMCRKDYDEKRILILAGVVDMIDAAPTIIEAEGAKE